MKRISKDIILAIVAMILNIGVFVLGVYIMIQPSIGFTAIQYAFIIMLGVKSVEEFLVYFAGENVLNRKMRLYQGIGFISLAGLVLVNTNVRMVSLLFMIISCLIIDIVLKCLVAYQYKKSQVFHWWLMLVSAMVSFLLIIGIMALPIASNYLLLRIFGVFICWEALVHIYHVFTQGQTLPKASKRWRHNFLFLHQGVYSKSFLPASLFTKVLDEVNAQNDRTQWEQKEDVVKHPLDDDKVPLYITIHSWDGDMFTMKGHSDFEFEGVAYSYGNYDNSNSLFNGSVSSGCLSVTEGGAYTQYCLHNEKKVLVRYTLQLSQEQAQLLRNYLSDMLGKMEVWEPPIMTQGTQDDDASKLYLTTQAKFYKFKSGQFKYYFVLNTNCIRFIEQLLQNINFEDPDIFGILTPGDYIEFFEKKLHDPKDTNVIARTVLVDATEWQQN